MRQRIAIDMDEVMTDALSRHLMLYNTEFNAILTVNDVLGRKLHEAVDPAHRSRVEAYPREVGFFKDLPIMPHSQAVIQQLMECYNVFITTAAMEYPTSFTDKYEWLQSHFPFIPWANIVFSGDKSIIAADYLIDDTVHHFAHFRGEGILFTAPHNVHITVYRRVNTWLDVRTLLLR